MKKHGDKIALVFLLIVNFVLYLPSLFEPVSYGDECIYLTLGNAFRQGLVFYRDIHDNKPPLLYLIAALANGRLFWLHLINIAWNLIHLVILYQLIKNLTKKKFSPLIGGIVFTLLLVFFEGRTANGEIFMIMPATLAVYLLFQYPKKKAFLFGALIGFLFSIGFLSKIPIFFDLIGILFAVYLLSFKKIGHFFKEPKFWGIIFGFFSPILLTIIYYSSKGAFTPYVRSALLQNIGYLSSWQGSNLGLFLRFGVLISLSLIIFLFRKKISYPVAFSFLWFVFALFGSLLSGRPYPHYLIEIIPGLSLLAALSVDQKKAASSFLAALSLILLYFSHLYFGFWRYPIASYYRNFISYWNKKINQEEYFNYWGQRTVDNYQIARFVSRNISENEPIFVWGEGSCIYALSGKLPPGRYTVNYHIFDFNGFGETLKAIEAVKPKIIIKLKDEKRNWPELDQYLEKNYHLFFSPKIPDQIYLSN